MAPWQAMQFPSAGYPFFPGLWAHASVMLVVLSLPSAASAQASEGSPDNPLVVEGVRPTDAGPLPGLLISRDQIPGNVQSALQKKIQDSRALSLGEFMNSQLQGVSIND